LEALGINLGYLITFALSFGILFVVLRAWVYQPLLGVLEKRRQTIARGLEDARIAAEARANAEKEADRITTEAQTKSVEIIREATERASKVEHEVRAQAEADMAKARETTRTELEGERNRMLSELRGQIVSLAVAAAQKLLADNLDERRQHTLVNEFFSGVRNGKVTILETTSLESDGSQLAEVTSALPLTEEEKASVQSEILAKLGGSVTVNFRVDPSILGGLVVKVGDRVVDGSLSGQLEDLRQSLH
jgi:F-type H+-transporting ATPase subunit b